MILLAVLSGVLGRMGGAHGYHTLWRDWGCAAVRVAALTLVLGWYPWVYLAVFILSWAAFSTYWQFLFKGKDTLWFAGLMAGIALCPIVCIDKDLFTFVLVYSVLLMVVWECLNRHLPQKIWVWTRDIVEEFCRYSVAL